jgi:hypothetical protein
MLICSLAYSLGLTPPRFGQGEFNLRYEQLHEGLSSMLQSWAWTFDVMVTQAVILQLKRVQEIMNC